ncbi:MAG: hypothetical protein ABIV25_07275 [Paracoccaceae bacterium]
MDKYQALAVMGFDGPDSLTPKVEIEVEIARLEAFESEPPIKARIAQLKKMLLNATDKGGFCPTPPGEDVISQERYATLAPLCR